MSKFQNKLAAAAIIWAGATAMFTLMVWALASFVQWEFANLMTTGGRVAVAGCALVALHLVWKSWDETK